MKTVFFARRWGRAGTIFLVILALGSLLVYPSARSTYAATPSNFDEEDNPSGLAAGPDTIFVTTCDPVENGSPIAKVRKSEGGAFAPFATVNGCEVGERIPIAVAHNLGSFAGSAGKPYVIVGPQGENGGPQIKEIAADGSSQKVVFEFDNGFEPQGIRFDDIGTFDFDLIVTGNVVGEGSFGQVWRFSLTSVGCPNSPPCLVPTGGETFPLDLADDVEGPVAVMPLSFSKCPGGLLVASPYEASGAVLCVEPDGSTPTVVALLPGANGVYFVAPNPCSLGSGAFFISVFDQEDVDKFAATDFTAAHPESAAGLDGRYALVTSPTSPNDGVGLIALLGPGSPVPPSTLDSDADFIFAQDVGEITGGDFCGRHRVQLARLPGGTKGKIPFVIFSAPSFNPHTDIDPTALTTCGRIGDEMSVHHFDNGQADFNGDGVADLKVHCDMKLTGLGPGEPAVITGFFVEQSPQEGFEGRE